VKLNLIKNEDITELQKKKLTSSEMNNFWEIIDELGSKFNASLKVLNRLQPNFK